MISAVGGSTSAAPALVSAPACSASGPRGLACAPGASFPSTKRVALHGSHLRRNQGERRPLPGQSCILSTSNFKSSQRVVSTNAALGATDQQELDVGVVASYFGATSVQWGALVGVLWILDRLPSLGSLGLPPVSDTILTAAFFFFLSFRSRIFSPLNNSRPEARDVRNEEKKWPSWTPPGIVFPIVWTTIGVLRSISATIIWTTFNYAYFNLPLALFLLHLSIGDTWNTINNVEKRLGVAVPGVITVLLSAILVDWAYFGMSTTAGWVLFPSCIWLSVATTLIISIWNINGRAPLYPVKSG